MSYIKQGFTNDQVLDAQHLNTMEDGIASKQDELVSGVNIKTINGISILGSGDISIQDGTLVDNAIKIYSDNPEEWIRQNMSGSGSVVLPGSTAYNKSNIMHNELFTEDIWLIPKVSVMWATVTYDANGVFIERGSWSTTTNNEPIHIPHTYDFNIIFATVDNDTDLTVEQMLAQFVLQNAEPVVEGEVSDEVKALNTRLNYFNFIQSCAIADKMVHFSIDDCCACMYDLIVNADTYTSPFENKFFGGLKEIHDETGACFTVNTFNVAASIPDYDISNVPSKFQSYFQENKSWLRFAFHSEADTTKYASTSITNEEALASYNRFVQAIYTLTGDYGCIDTITRIGFFNCSLEKALLFKNAEHGTIGYLAADDDRVSNYYLNNKQRLTVRKKGKYYDLDNELVFVNTLNRTYSKGLAELQGNPMYQKFAEFFWHESENSGKPNTWVKEAAKYCNEKGYIHGFLMDIFSPVE